MEIEKYAIQIMINNFGENLGGNNYNQDSQRYSPETWWAIFEKAISK